MAPKPAVLEFPVIPGIDKIVEVVGNIPDSFFLDSADQTHSARRFSYAGLTPPDVLSGNSNPWATLDSAYREIARPVDSSVPFCGGLAGFIGYEGNYRFGLYDSVLVFDHRENRSLLASWKLSTTELKTEADRWMNLLESTPIRDEQTEAAGKIHFPWTYERYQEKIQNIKDYLIAGDVYQINLTGRFEVETTRSSSSIYKRLRKISPAPYSTFLNCGDFQILSASPECFMEINGNQITTRPIKGTRRRSAYPMEDARLRQELLSSEKDGAELLMIVDLERNDLGKICEYGSVRVGAIHPIKRGRSLCDELPLRFDIETFAQVHHLVTAVSGRLKPEITPVAALQTLFPGGSVTGAPKIRAMEIISELEETPRSVYTGALGYIGAGGNTLLNIPIRTLTKRGDKVAFHAGGGIVIDSDPLAEYEEMMVKAEGMMKALS
ncbi:MAG: aminodeoxychorismate synthase component I [Deltaproteobacteria bacterium]|nr:aminodeoxychorismate synthase component I [Deltaproteobacteria bacterium]